MGLHQLVGGSAGSVHSPMRFQSIEKKFNGQKQPFARDITYHLALFQGLMDPYLA